jgi:N-acetyl-gamma-glutamyl-phosphate reductase
MVHSPSTRPRVFIDGQAGTIGLRMHALLAGREDLELLAIDTARRKDPSARAELLNTADLSILCLPDAAAREAVSLMTSPSARVIDGSSAHRVAEGWVYGLPELAKGQREAIAAAKRVSNPGCYPTGVALLLRPLIDAELLARDTPICVHALSGYSGGGTALIDRWQAPANGLLSLPYEAPYALERRHKHVPEMVRYAGLAHDPYFVPAVGPFYCGERVEIPLHAAVLARGADGADVLAALRARYEGERFIRVQSISEALGERVLDPTCCNGTNRVELRVLPHPNGHLLLVALLDNLGKGAAGAAVQSLNLMLGLAEDSGLCTYAPAT